jgi:hypothetical protein
MVLGTQQGHCQLERVAVGPALFEAVQQWRILCLVLTLDFTTRRLPTAVRHQS